MAQGDVFIFNDGLENLTNGDWGAADVMKCAIITDATTPVVGQVAPVLTTYTEVATGGTYAAGGTTLGALAAACISQSGGVLTFDSSTNISYDANGSNGTNARWGLIYNSTTASECLAYVDLGTTVNMQTDNLTITWSASGIFTIS